MANTNPKQQSRGTTRPAFEAGPGVNASARDLADARLLALLNTALSTSEAATRLGVSERTVRRWISRRMLLAGQRHSRWLLPEFQFSLYDDSLVEGFSEVCQALPPELPLLAVHAWFNTANSALYIEEDNSDATPLEWLRAWFPVAEAVAAAQQAG